MENLFKAVCTISSELNEISKESIPDEISNLKFRGDNANFSISLFQEYLINPNTQIKNFISILAKTIFRWSDNNLFNGYEKMATAHHGPELFLGFLPRYIDVFPDEKKSKSLLLGAAEYIGNWKKDFPKWFDYENESFKSWYLGSVGTDSRKVAAYETADHLRFLHIALIAWKIGGGNKYIEWALKYGKKFAKRIVESDEIIPVAWGPKGECYYPEDMSLSIAAIFNPFKKLGADIFGTIGVAKDTRQDNDFHFGFGVSLHYRLMRSSSFSLVPLLTIPFDIHLRNDDAYDEDGSSHLVFLPILSPRIGVQSEIMVSPKIDLVIRGEYILTNGNIGEWRYTEENHDEDEKKTLYANWNEEIEPPPEIYYHGWDFTIGIRIVNLIQSDSKGFSIGKLNY